MADLQRLADQYAELYYGDFSLTAQIRLADDLIASVQAGELTEQELREDIRHLQQNPIWN